MTDQIEHINYCGTPSGYDAVQLARLTKKHGRICHIARDDSRMSFLQEAIKIIDPNIEVLVFPAWDTVPYDRSAPLPDITGQRIDTLIRLSNEEKTYKPKLVLTTVSAVIQLLPPVSFFTNSSFLIQEGQSICFDNLKLFLVKNGYRTTDTVMEVGEFAVRGGLIDLFPSGYKNPIRVDFFGDIVDSIKSFDALTQRTIGTIKGFSLKPVMEFQFSPESISLFRSKYRSLFERGMDDVIYESVSNGRYIQGVEHYLPLFYEHMSSFFDYLTHFTLSFDFQWEGALQHRIEQIEEYYQARLTALKDSLPHMIKPYYPIPPDLFFMNKKQIDNKISSFNTLNFSPFVEPSFHDLGGRAGHDFIDIRVRDMTELFDQVVSFINNEKRKIIIAATSYGSCQRLSGLLRDKGISLYEAENWQEALQKAPSLLITPFEKGFSNNEFIVLTETDILGERIIRPPKRRKNSDFITDVTTLNKGDLVVHQLHGIGRFQGLITLNIGEALHDCLEIMYEGDDKLFVPVENADVLSRYGSENASLDKLGGISFATRKERVKKDLFAMAEHLIQTASMRALNKTEHILPPHGVYQEFCARFPYNETEDQLRTIREIEEDLAQGKPMDRLVCGDVGFGKTEVALRAAFLVAMAGYQVAVIAPTTLLARQHAQNFTERFKGFPIRVAGLSRLVSYHTAQKIHKELEEGTLDIIIGTHALLSKTIRFKNLGLVIIDEEQHFGVSHKERLKEIKQGVHVLTLTATPIPRTLQLSLSGVRELSIIATPPIDRLAVKTFVSSFDPVIIKEAILREHFRGGQTFFVCPRISDMAEIRDILKKLLPDIRVVEAHGQMPPAQLEKIMIGFADKMYDVLVATSIVESGLDIPSVNTIIVYRADMFGLAALYQLRGRVGRGKLRAYAYLTTMPDKRLSETAQKRLTVMQTLDSLGAGFALASHDLDIRGAGNLLGNEQSGHIREVGIALYQKMLKEAILTLKAKSEGKTELSTEYSPQIFVGLPVLIPETYISDLEVRMTLYNRISHIETLAEIDSLRAELIDRFGNYPKEVDNLLITIQLKILAKTAHIERLDAGPKGANISFYENTFPNPAGLIDYISSQMGTIKIRPDQKIIVMRPWNAMADRLEGVKKIISKLADIASQKKTIS